MEVAHVHTYESGQHTRLHATELGEEQEMQFPSVHDWDSEQHSYLLSAFGPQILLGETQEGVAVHAPPKHTWGEVQQEELQTVSGGTQAVPPLQFSDGTQMSGQGISPEGHVLPLKEGEPSSFEARSTSGIAPTSLWETSVES